MVDLLLQHEAKVDGLDSIGGVALHVASKKGHTDVMETLLSNGADADARGRRLWTPLHCAAFNGHVAAVKTLLNKTADPDMKTFFGQTPLHLACRQSHRSVADLLLSSSSDIEARNEQYETPLLYAAQWGQTDMVQLLTRKGCNLAAVDKDGKNALHLALSNEHFDTAEFLSSVLGTSLTNEDSVPEEGQTSQTDLRMHAQKEKNQEDGIRGALARLGRRAISLYQKALERGCIKVSFALLVVSGKDGAGKTSLVDSLLDLRFQENQLSTRGTAVRMAFKSTRGWEGQEARSIADDLLVKGFVEGQRVSAACTVVPGRSSLNHQSESIPTERESQYQPNNVDDEIQRIEKKYEEMMSRSSIGQDLATVCRELTKEQAWLIEQLRQDEDLCDVYEKIMVTMIRDLGGQEVFLPTHAGLMTNSKKFRNTAYIVVTNLTRDPNGISQSTYRPQNGLDALPLEPVRIKSDSDYIRYFLSAIKSAHGKEEPPSHYLGDTEGVASPPVFFVATHAGEPKSAEAMHDHEAKVLNIVKSRSYEAHVVTPGVEGANFMFPVDNTKSGTGDPDKMLLVLKERIEQMAMQHSLSQDPIPLSWFVLWKMVDRLSRMPQYKLAELRNVIILAQHVCEIERVEEVCLALQCLSSYGLFLYYPEAPRVSHLVITDPQWLSDVFSSFVNVIDKSQLPPILREDAEVLLHTGLMSWALAKYQMGNVGIGEEIMPSLLGVFELFDIAFPTEDNVRLDCGLDLFVPCMIREDYDGSFLWQQDFMCHERPPSLVFRPMGIELLLETLYFRLVARFAAKMKGNFILKRDRALIHLPDDLDLELAYHKGRYIIVTIKSVSEIQSLDAPAYKIHCNDIREFICLQLEDAKQIGMSGLNLELCCMLPSTAAVHVDFEKDIDEQQLVSLQNYNPREPLLLNGKGEHISSSGPGKLVNIWFGHIRARKRSSDLRRVPTCKEITRVASKLGRRWKAVARWLKPKPFSSVAIEDIVYGHPKSYSEQAHAMLDTWLGIHGSKATVRNLKASLRKAKCRRIAEKVFGRNMD
jgi:GTPase SAR1 family protein